MKIFNKQYTVQYKFNMTVMKKENEKFTENNSI